MKQTSAPSRWRAPRCSFPLGVACHERSRSKRRRATVREMKEPVSAVHLRQEGGYAFGYNPPYALRVTPDGGDYSIQSACLKRATSGLRQWTKASQFDRPVSGTEQRNRANARHSATRAVQAARPQSGVTSCVLSGVATRSSACAGPRPPCDWRPGRSECLAE
jgi:hypothetical protein